jgi:hypothetical protein
LRHFGHVGDHALDRGAVDPERIIAHERFARQFEEYTLVGGFGHDEAGSYVMFRIRV